jgi:hypothetical protein
MTKEKSIQFQIPDSVKVVMEHHFDFASIRLRSDGITQINYADDKTYELEDMKKIHDVIKKFNMHQPLLLLYIPGIHTSSDDEARKFMANQEKKENRIGSSYVIKSLAHRLIANFYLKFFKPKNPSGFFSNQEDAERWLLKMKHNIRSAN